MNVHNMPSVGTVWRDRDARLFRFVVVEGVHRTPTSAAPKVMVRNVEPPHAGYVCSAGAAVSPVGRFAQISLKTFHKRFAQQAGL